MKWKNRRIRRLGGAINTVALGLAPVIGSEVRRSSAAFRSPGISGTLVVTVRCRDGVLLASDSRVYDTISHSIRDGVQKFNTKGPWAWFLTGQRTFGSYRPARGRELSDIDLYQLTQSVGIQNEAQSALEMVKAVAAQAADTLNAFYSSQNVALLAAKEDLPVAVLGVVHQAQELALARLLIRSDGRGVRAELIPVATIPRTGVFGNDRVYRAIKNQHSGFSEGKTLPVFRNVMTDDDDPSRSAAVEFAGRLIEITSRRDGEFGPTDHPVGGAPWIAFLTSQGTEWIARP